MKKLKTITLCVFLLCISSNHIQAQYKSIFGDSSTMWVYQGISAVFNTLQDTVYVQKDTILNNLHYKKVTNRYYQNGFNGGLLREDTLHGLVWYKSIPTSFSSDTLERIAFNYNLNKGDTFNIDNMYYGPNGTSSWDNTVDTTYYINGIKYIQFNALYFGEPITEIEGVGGIMSILWKQYDRPPLATQYLLCSYKDGVQTYTNKRYNGNCNVWQNTAINDIETYNNEIKIYPNPATNNISVQYLGNKGSKIAISLRDINGKVVIATDTKAVSQYQITNFDIAKLTTGIYIINIVDDNGTTHNYKFIKK